LARPPRRTFIEATAPDRFYANMIPNSTKGARFGFALLGALALLAPAAAVAAQPAFGSAPETPDDALSRNLKLISESPHNVGALIGAGKAALELGDAQAALSFFARAEQDAPRDGWVKKWEGSALVQLEQPAAAIKFFRDAVSLGLPEASVAGDRGLAWDISGDPRRAQRDYRLALAHGSDPEVTRRLALSLAISGEREPALQLLQDQLAQRDRAAMRTRALVLALTGDWQSADRVVEAELPGGEASALEPFLARLPSLSLADRALAVHLGHFPGKGGSGSPPPTYAQNNFGGGLPAGYTPRSYPSAPAAASAVPAQDASDDGDDADDSRPGFSQPVARPEPASTEPRRIPGAHSEAPAAPRPGPARSRSRTFAPPLSPWSWSRDELFSHPAAARTASREPERPQLAPPRTQAPTAPPIEAPARRPVEIADARPTAIPPSVPPPAPRQAEPERAAPAPQPAPRSRLAEVAAELDRIDDEQRARRGPERMAAADTRGAASHARAVAEPEPRYKKTPPPEAREPARHWVQIAHASDPDILPREFNRLKDKAPKLLAGRAAWTASARSTNRLLIGPFESDEAAQRFVDRLEKADLTGLAWTSDAGQKVEKLTAR
jgi:Flp pilus assembly protein TadD